ncbi:EpsD family peptidyl-prolyl cis-trans isomerase [Chlorobium sp. N1]|uniref:EpsD family peptidyl-prolyl cis-trans isomerase n=1 Tax=Chlorobium sp. N1 TaxID=2491138 RepID=UPI0013F169C5|nr:EpsD family peptidyl-prolyl cis-trans isomerase [Chlorobium sp. N1]
MRWFPGLLLFLAVLGGCSSPATPASSSRVAASVNGVEITAREVDFLYERGADPGASEADRLNRRRMILGGLVRSELLAQKARASKLDRTPEYILSMHTAERGVLASMAERRLQDGVESVSPEEARRVVTANPSSFAERKLLVYDEVLLPDVDLPFLDSLNAMAGRGASFEALMRRVSSRKKAYRRTKRALASEQVQPAILKVLLAQKPERPLVARVEDRFAMILVLHSVTSAPITGETAVRAASGSLGSARRKAAVSRGVAEALDGAKIDYFGEFAPDARRDSLLAALPEPSEARIGFRRHRLLKAGLALSGVFGVGVLLLVSLLGIGRGAPWSPFPGAHSGKGAGMRAIEKYLVERPVLSPLQRVLLFAVSVSGLALLGFQLLLVWGSASPLELFGSAAGGSLAGFLAGLLYARLPLSRWVFRRASRQMLSLLLLLLILAAGVAFTRFSFG